MKINRLFGIVYVLIDKKTVTAKYLAEYFDVSVRTIYRDIDILSAAGIPIYTNKGRGGGISLLDNFVLNKAFLSEQEQNGILMSLQSLNAVRFPDAEPALKKLSMLFNKTDTDWIEVDFSHWGSNRSESDKFNLLRDAIINTRIISFIYYNSNGETTLRRVEPLKLVFKEHNWYLNGFCLLKNDFRLFKIKRMKNLTILEKAIKRSSNIPAIQNTSYTGKMVTLTLKIDKEMTYRVYDEFDENQISINSDGTFQVIFTVPEDEWIYGYILSFGNYAEVLEPTHIREIITQKLQATLKKYF